LTDRQGSVRDITDNTGTVQDTISYDGWGNVTSETHPGWGDRYKWTGRDLDIQTGLQYNRARWYDPTTGRWTSQDPLGFEAGDSNLYRYVRNHATSFRDPSGLSEVEGAYPAEEGKDVGVLDRQFTTFPYREMARYARGEVQATLRKSGYLNDVEFPASFDKVGPITFTNKDITQHGSTIKAGSVGFGYYMFFVEFPICETKDAPLGIRVSETGISKFNTTNWFMRPKKFEGVVPPMGDAWTKAKYQPALLKKDSKYDQAIIYVDSPGWYVFTKAIKKGTAGLDQDVKPQSYTTMIFQKIEVINTQTGKALLTQLLLIDLHLREDGKVDATIEGGPAVRRQIVYLLLAGGSPYLP
jgi:RHS repeat-associated protein